MISLLFHTNRRFLGTIDTERGALKNVELNELGEAYLGSAFTEWQLLGTPTTVYDTIHVAPDIERHFFYEDTVAVNTDEWQHALEAWGRKHQLIIMSLSPAQIDYWKQMETWPLGTVERFELIFALKQTSPADLREWDVLFQETQAKLQTQS